MLNNFMYKCTTVHSVPIIFMLTFISMYFQAEDPDQMASPGASWSGSSVFKTGFINLGSAGQGSSSFFYFLCHSGDVWAFSQNTLIKHCLTCKKTCFPKIQPHPCCFDTAITYLSSLQKMQLSNEIMFKLSNLTANISPNLALYQS